MISKIINIAILLSILFLLFRLNRNSFMINSSQKSKQFKSLSYFKMWYNLAFQITQKESSIAVLRYGDGESSIMDKRSFKGTKNDKFHFHGGTTKLGIDLNRTLKGNNGKNCFYCIPFYNPEFTKLANNIDQDMQYIYSANIFVNFNYNKTKDLLISLLYDEYKSIILLCNEKVKYTDFADEVIYFPNEIVQWYESNRNKILVKIKNIAKKYRNRLFMVSVGPLSEVLIWYMFNENPYNRYVDFGSSTDELIKQKSTRRYTYYKSSTSHLIDPLYVKGDNNKIKFSLKHFNISN